MPEYKAIYDKIFKSTRTNELQIIIDRFNNNWKRFSKLIEDEPIRKSEWVISSTYQSPGYWDIDKRYYGFIFSLARFLDIKVIWVNGLSKYHQPFKSIKVAGEKIRVKTFIHIFHTNLISIYNYQLLNARKLSSKQIESIFKILNICVAKSLERKILDDNYEYELRRFVQNHFKLDYKNYSNKPTYENAISRSFYPKRVLL